MKILQILHCFPPESMTGSEIYAYNLSMELSRNHKVSVFYRINDSSGKGYEVIKSRYNGLDVYKINNTLKDYNSIERIYKNAEIESRFLQVLNEVRPDVVHVHHLLFLSLGLLDEIKKRNIPIIFTLHDYWLICPRGQLFKNNLKLCKNPLNANCLFCLGMGLNIKNLFKRLSRLQVSFRPRKGKAYILKDICEKVDLFISPSNFLRERFIVFGIPPEKIIYSDNGMEPSLFQDIEKAKSDMVRFGFIGTLIPSKGAHILIKAFNKIESGRAVLKIYGKPPKNNGIFDYFSRIRTIARGNKNIKFMGVFDNKEIARIFKEIDVLIFPSLWEENSPLVLHEAILTKTPILASDIGGVSELVRNGENGFLFSPGNVKELYEHIRNIIDNPLVTRNMVFDTDGIKGITDNCKEMEGIYAEKANQ